MPGATPATSDAAFLNFVDRGGPEAVRAARAGVGPTNGLNPLRGSSPTGCLSVAPKGWARAGRAQEAELVFMRRNRLREAVVACCV